MSGIVFPCGFPTEKNEKVVTGDREGIVRQSVPQVLDIPGHHSLLYATNLEMHYLKCGPLLRMA